ncbi:K+ homeostasis protein kha1 [Lasiodiplodia theobromae]|uniref:K(+)/H(+) antiporter 1 n=1 Tax=Lasiodiplodia theobromae TaxID=45133 RepID=A0A5N5CYW7_9PEZI|nr:K+ homeostasis protein kha1 [Lasiodiplodia theobromae]KAB2570565.1 K(+)/H(+) antiporter 1 [Lasiodiplodia theobromae]KAF4541743.1 K+ homeostasis protein kha1 [Lasiodiplodia theobromae]
MSSVTSSAATATATSSTKVPEQAGILEGNNPTHYNPKDPIILFIIQAGIIIIFCRALHYPLQKLRQPRVIAEVIGGILLGPSVMGQIPHFTETIFPTASMPALTLVANLGLVLFLFLVGLEVDLRFLLSNWKIAASVGVAGMALPFGLGAAISYGLYNEFHGEGGTVPINFGVYLLFIGVAMAITAFPVLCRILTELKLLTTPVGVIVLSAGVGNDVVGWILLALCVALVNAGSGITALWVLLVAVGYVLFVWYAVKPAFWWVLRRSRALQDGPSQGIIAMTMLLTLTSAFFTGVIGIHPIFGAFIIGLICPHEGGFAIKLTEKIEDIVGAVFLPLYFALSGLNTNLGLLNTGMTWAYVIGVVCVAFFGKFLGASGAARACGLVWRESFTIGALMSCKGLVELIVLNIGLQAKILSQRTFTIFVVMALITTFVTTPLTSWLYPPHYQRKIEAWKRGEIDWDTGAAISHREDSTDAVSFEKLESAKVQSLLVYLRLDSMSALLPLVSLFGATSSSGKNKVHPSKPSESHEQEGSTVAKRPVKAHGIRLLGLTDRESSVMKVSEVDEFGLHDPVVNTFRTFGYLNNLAISGEVDVTQEESFSDTLVSRASDMSSDLVIIPWSETGNMSELVAISNDAVRRKLHTSAYNSFVTSILNKTSSVTAVFINENFGGSGKKDRKKLQRSISHISLRSSQEKNIPIAPSADKTHHIFFPFFGGADDRAAIRLVLQLAEHPDVTATIVHFETPDGYFDYSAEITPAVETDSPATSKQPTTTVAPSADKDGAFFQALRSSVPSELQDSVLFDSVTTTSPISAAIERAQSEIGQNPRNAGDLIVLGRSIAQFAAFTKENVKDVPRDDIDSEAQKCLGVVAETAVRSKVKASILVVQGRTLPTE